MALDPSEYSEPGAFDYLDDPGIAMPELPEEWKQQALAAYGAGPDVPPAPGAPDELGLAPAPGVNPIGGRAPGARDNVQEGAYATPGEWPPREWVPDLVDPREWTGEPAAPKSYHTELAPAEERDFQAWVKQNKVPFDPSPTADYDMRGYWKALQSDDPRAAGAVAPDGKYHYPDTWKTPYHATVSDESLYAPPGAPHWEGDVLYTPDGRIVADERSPADQRRLGAQAPRDPGPIPEVDAISGVGGQPPVPSERAEWMIDALPAFAERVGYDAGNIENADPARRQAYLDDVARRDPERFARIAEAHKQVGDEQALAQAARAATQNRIDAEANFKAHKEATDRALKERTAIDAESKKLAESAKYDPRRVWKNAGVLGKLGRVILGIVGGLVQSRQGGTNKGLEIIDKEVEQDLEAHRAEFAAKTADLNRRQGRADRALTQADTSYRQLELYRAAKYETILREIETQRAQFDQRGTQAIRLAQLGEEVRGRRAQALQAATEKMQKTFFEATKIDQEQQKIDIQRAEAQAKALAKASRGVGAGGGYTGTGFTATGALDEKTPRTPEQLAVIFGLGTDDPRPTVPMSMEQYRNDFLGAKHKLGEITGAKHKLGEEERKVALERGGFGNIEIDKDGKPKPFIPNGTPEAVEKFRSRFAATTHLVNLLDEAMSIRTGWTSDTAKSEEWQKLKSIWGDVFITAKDAGQLGVLAGPDMKVIEEWVGTDDPTRWRGITGRVEQARKNIEGGLRNDMAHRGLSKEAAAKWGIPNPYANKPKPTPGEATLKNVLEKGDLVEDYRTAFGETTPTVEQMNAFQADQRQRFGMSLAQKAALDAWAADLKKPKGSKELEFAVAALSRASKDAAAEGVRDYASKLLQPVNEATEAPGTWGGGTGLTYQP